MNFYDQTATTEPQAKELGIFISHGWDWNESYSKVLGWLSSSRDLKWRSCSFPCHGGMDDISAKNLQREITCQIQSADIVIILSGMHPPQSTYIHDRQYADHRKWVKYQIQEARRLGKTIIGVKPWDGSDAPTLIQEASICDPVAWNAKSIVEAVRSHAPTTEIEIAQPSVVAA